jgi:hemerythrin superfamily protein
MSKNIGFNEETVEEIKKLAYPYSWSQWVHMQVKKGLDNCKQSEAKKIDLSHEKIEQLTENIAKNNSQEANNRQ